MLTYMSILEYMLCVYLSVETWLTQMEIHTGTASVNI